MINQLAQLMVAVMVMKMSTNVATQVIAQFIHPDDPRILRFFAKDQKGKAPSWAIGKAPKPAAWSTWKTVGNFSVYSFSTAKASPASSTGTCRTELYVGGQYKDKRRTYGITQQECKQQLDELMNILRSKPERFEEPKWRMIQRSEIAKAIEEELRVEVNWGEKTKDGKAIWGKEEGSKWARKEWGKIEGGMITLFHGTSPYDLPSILKNGLTAGWDVPPEELGLEEGEEPPPKTVWLTVTPYLAFFHNDVCLRVRIPIGWVDYVDIGDAVLVERDIPPERILEVKTLEEWRSGV